MKKILVVTTFNNHFRFFYRLSQTLKSLDFEAHFITNKLSILKDAENLRVKINLLDKSDVSKTKVNVYDSFEVAAGFLTPDKAEKIVGAVWAKLEQLFDENKYDYLFLWGGVRLIELTATEFAKHKNLQTIFFELGNFPNKIFVDPQGTNARALLADNPNILSKLDYDLKKYKQWAEKYISDSLRLHSVPQSKSAVNVEYNKNLNDFIGFKFRKLVQTEPILTKEKMIGKYLRRVLKINYDKISLANTQYIFYPMQVNKDAQLILNSEIGNLEALRIASDLARESGVKLLVKPHPGEVEFGFIKKVNTLKEKLGFAFVNNNTIELIKSAQEVITINSTVGLQAKIAGKKVKCLGKAFYQVFNENMLAAYLQSYLVDADFWGENKIPIDSAKEIISRAGL